MPKLRRGASKALRFIRRSNLAEFLAYSLSTAMFVIGLSLLTIPDQHQVATFAPALDFASFEAWSLVMIGTSILCAVMVKTQRAWAFVPFMIQTTVWSIWATFTISAVPGGGVPSAGVVYTLAAWLAFVVTAVYWGELGKPQGTEVRSWEGAR